MLRRPCSCDCDIARSAATRVTARARCADSASRRKTVPNRILSVLLQLGEGTMTRAERGPRGPARPRPRRLRIFRHVAALTFAWGRR
jgi:hypothetical protein